MSFKIADAYVEIHADDSKLPDEVRRSLARLGDDTASDSDKAGSVIGEHIASGLSNSTSSRLRDERGRFISGGSDIGDSISQGFLGRLGSMFDNVKGKYNSFFNDFKSKAKDAAASGLQLVGNLSNAGSAISAVMTLTSVATQLSGVLGLLPAAALAGVGALLAFKLGADGLKAAFQNLNPVLDTLKSKVSASFQSSLLPAVNNLKAVLPQLTSGFQQIATAMGGVLTKVTLWMKTPAAIGQLNTILGGTARIIQNIGSAFTPLIAAFVRVGSVAMPILVQLTAGLGQAAEKFNAWVQRMADTGNIQQWIQGGLSALKNLFDELSAIGRLVGTVFGAFQDAGVSSGNAVTASLSLLGLKLGGIPGMIVGSLIPALTQFANTPAGHDMLVMLSQDLAKISNIVSGVLVAAFNAIAPVLPGLLTVFTNLATVAGNILVPALNFLGPPLKVIGDFVANNAGLITGIAVAIGIWTAAQWLLNFALDANPIGLFIMAVTALVAIVAVIIAYWGPISTFFANLWTSVSNWFVSVWNSIWQFLVNLWNSIQNIAVTVWNAIKQFFADWWPFVLGIFTGGIGLIVGLIIQHWNQIRDFTVNVFNAVRDFFVNVWNNIVGFVTGAANNIWNAIRNGVSNAYNAVVSGLSNAVSWVAGLPGRILGALGNLGSLLWNAGASIINGLLNGLKSAWQSVTNFVSGIAGWIADHKGPITYDVQLLVPHGNAIMDGLKSGLVNGFTSVQSLVNDMASQIAEPFANLGNMVQYGSVSDATWNQLLAAGWKGNPNDGMEALYRPPTPVASTSSTSSSAVRIDNLTIQVAGNLDPTDPVKWTAALLSIRDGIRKVERSYAQ